MSYRSPKWCYHMPISTNHYNKPRWFKMNKNFIVKKHNYTIFTYASLPGHILNETIYWQSFILTYSPQLAAVLILQKQISQQSEIDSTSHNRSTESHTSPLGHGDHVRQTNTVSHGDSFFPVHVMSYVSSFYIVY